MENTPKLWDKDSELLRTLRPPNSIPAPLEQQDSNSRQQSHFSGCNVINKSREPRIDLGALENNLPNIEKSFTIKNENNLEDIIAKSILKADAAEWYPSSTYTTTSRIQNRLNIHKSSHDVEEVHNVNLGEKSNCNNWPNQFYDIDEDSPDIRRIKHIINTLTNDPGQFDDLLDLFMETLIPYFGNIIAFSIIAQLLVEQAINNPNFRYTGARLCWHIEQNCPEFRAELHLKCKKQVEDNAYKQNVLLFIAELYTQLPHLTVYGALLINCFKQLLSEGGNNNIKCICQALKLTGFSLEESNRNDLVEVFTQLKAARNTVTGTALTLVNSIITLQASNWGRSSESTSNADAESERFYYPDIEDTMFYNTDGHTFTREEREFLVAHMDSNAECLSDNSDPDDLCDPEPEMDEEIQAAFKEFVKFSKH